MRRTDNKMEGLAKEANEAKEAKQHNVHTAVKLFIFHHQLANHSDFFLPKLVGQAYQKAKSGILHVVGVLRVDLQKSEESLHRCHLETRHDCGGRNKLVDQKDLATNLLT